MKPRFRLFGVSRAAVFGISTAWLAAGLTGGVVMAAEEGTGEAVVVETAEKGEKPAEDGQAPAAAEAPKTAETPAGAEAPKAAEGLEVPAGGGAAVPVAPVTPVTPVTPVAPVVPTDGGAGGVIPVPAPVPALEQVPSGAGVVPGVVDPVVPGVVPMQPGMPEVPGGPVPLAGGMPLPDPAALAPGGQTGDFTVPVAGQRSANLIDRIGEPMPVAEGFGDRPTGFSNFFGDFSLANRLSENPLEGFSFGASLVGTYDTNPTQGYRVGAVNGSNDGDFFATLGGNVSYRSTASALTFGATYNGSYNEYFDQNDLSGYNQSASVSANYEGGAWTATLNVGVSMGNGANRYYEAYVEQMSYNLALSASYRMSAKTSLNASIGQTFTDADSNYSSTGGLNANVAAMWRYSERTQVGPGLRYTANSGSGSSYRETFGPTVNLNYRLTGKISLTSRLGWDFAEYEGGQDDSTWSASISANYRASELWGMTLSFYRDTQSSPTFRDGRGDQEVNNLSLSYYRQILRATWNVTATYEMGGRGTAANPYSNEVDTDYFNVSTGLSMPVFANRASARMFVNWSNHGRGAYTQSEDSLQVGAGINWSF